MWCYCTHQWWLCVWTTCPFHKINQSWAQQQPRDTLKFSRYTIKISLPTHCISYITKMSDVTAVYSVCCWRHDDSHEKVQFHKSKVVQTVTLPYKTIRDSWYGIKKHYCNYLTDIIIVLWITISEKDNFHITLLIFTILVLWYCFFILLIILLLKMIVASAIWVLHLAILQNLKNSLWKNFPCAFILKNQQKMYGKYCL